MQLTFKVKFYSFRTIFKTGNHLRNNIKNTQKKWERWILLRREKRISCGKRRPRSGWKCKMKNFNIKGVWKRKIVKTLRRTHKTRCNNWLKSEPQTQGLNLKINSGKRILVWTYKPNDVLYRYIDRSICELFQFE